MIVSCPSCHVHYRQLPPPVEAVLARCSRCDETFDLEPPKARYRLVPVNVAPAFEPPAFAPRSEMPIDVPASPLTTDPFDAALDPAATGEAVAAADGSVEEAATARRGRRVSLFGVLFGLMLAGGAAAAGYYLALQGMLGTADTLTGAAGGAGVGVLLAVAVIRMTMRAR